MDVGTMIEIVLAVIAIYVVFVAVKNVMPIVVSTIVVGGVLYLIFKLLGMLPWGGIGYFLLQLVAVAILLAVLVVIGLCLQQVCVRCKRVKIVVNGFFVLMAFYLLGTDDNVVWYNYIYFFVVALWSNNKLSMRGRVMRLIGHCKDVDMSDMFFFAGIATAMGTILIYQMNFTLLHSTWIYLVMAVVGIIWLVLADWEEYMKSAREVVGFLYQHGFLTAEIASDTLKKHRFTDANEIRDNILSRIESNDEFVTLSGKHQIIFRKDVLERIEIGVKERRDTPAIQADLKSKLEVDMIPSAIDAAIGALNVEVGQEYSPVNKGFMLIKYRFKANPAKAGSKKHRKAYYHTVRHIVETLTDDSEVYPQLWERLRSELNLPDTVAAEGYDIDKCVKELCNTGLTMQGFMRFVDVDNRYSALLEAFYLLDLREGHLKYDALQEWADRLRLRSNEIKIITEFLEMTFRPQSNLQAYIAEISDGHLRQGMEYLLRNIDWNRTFVNLPHYEVAVCAPMSSGKSTFVNAILGYDYIPSSNQACTAKVTSIADNDKLANVIGCTVTKDGQHHFSADVGHEMLQRWNENANIERVLLEGNLQTIESQKGVLVVHDTPGTNYAEDASHEKQTMDFLNEKSINLVIFIFNGQHTTTDDTDKLLTRIKESVLDKQETEVLFLVNKMDAFDEENGDDIGDTLQKLREDLLTKNFVAPTVFPIAANAARIFQKALRQEQMTKRESREFAGLYEQFGVDGFDLTKPEWIGGTRPDKKLITIQSPKVTVNGKEYDSRVLEIAMQRTGIGVVAAYLDEKINGGKTA